MRTLGLSGCDSGGPEPTAGPPAGPRPRVQRYVRLGRTELEVSDISFGSGGVDHPRTVRHAYESGVNYFDTAKIYENGRAERFIGQALKDVRDKVYIATKVVTEPHWSRKLIMANLEGSLRRLQTDYVDVFLNQACNDVARLESQEWQEFVAQAKQQGKIRFVGVSGHGGRLQQCLDYALDHDMVDMILASHNFGTDPAFYEKFTEAFDLIANQKGITRIFAKARAQDVGVMCMKTTMGAKLNDLRQYEWGGATFSQAAFRWVLSNPDVNALLISMRSVPLVDEYLGASGQTTVGWRDRRLLREYVRAESDRTCRAGCDRCAGSCPEGVAIDDVLRARMYALRYEDPRKAADSYAAGTGAAACLACTHQACLGACPFGLAIPELTRETARLLEPA
jgi:predicted aldo/keto reductase-like oxidoreductase